MLDLDAGDRDVSLGPDSACANVSAEPTLLERPIDIVLVVDNSGSMGDDILAVQANINDNFAGVLAAAGIDFRVVLVSLHGWSDTAEAICIEKPLSKADCNPAPPQPGQNPPIFFHYSTEIASNDPICKLMSTYDGTLPDDFGLAPTGWSEWLRPEAYKVFAAITDDRIACGSYDDQGTLAQGTAAAAAIDADLLALSPTHFGDASKRNYEWHSILGMLANASATDPWLPQDPIQLGTCGTGVTPGTGYQALSILTGGLRFPICEHASYGPVFQAIAASAIAGATLVCEFAVPDPPAGETIDLDSVVVEYTPGDGSPKQTLTQVGSAAACAPGSFYIEAGTIMLCPEACTGVQDDPKAKLLVLFDCEQVAR
jgi:hypothetical protein